MTRRLTSLATWLIGAALAVVMTWPLMSAPGSLARMDTYDGKFSVWNIAWVAHALRTQPTQVFNANIFHPHEGTLLYSEANLVAGAAAMPVYALTSNPIAAHNLVVFLALVLAFVLTVHLLARLGAPTWVAMPPAAAFAFSAYVSAHTAHVQLLLVFVVPLVLIAWHRFEEAPTTRRGAVLGVALTFSVLTCAYYGIMMGLAVGVAALWFAPWRERARPYWLGLATAVLVTGVTVLPIAVPYASLRVQGMRSALNVDEARSYSADYRTYLRGHSGPLTKVLPASWRAELDDYVGRNGEVLFPGLVTLVLASIGLVVGVVATSRSTPQTRDRGAPRPRILGFYVALLLLAIWASMGPRAGLYLWLAEIIPFMSFLRAPARFGVLVLAVLAVFAAWGLAWLTHGRRWASAIALSLLAMAAFELRVRWPLRPVPTVAQAYRTLATLPRGGTLVLHFPYRRGEWFPHVDHMFWSMWHWQPLVNGYSDYIPPDVADLAVPINSFPSVEAFRILRTRNVRYVAIDWRTYNEAATAVMRSRFEPFAPYLRPLVTEGDVSLYEIAAWPE